MYTSATGTVTFEPSAKTHTCSLPTMKLPSATVQFLITIPLQPVSLYTVTSFSITISSRFWYFGTYALLTWCSLCGRWSTYTRIYEIIVWHRGCPFSGMLWATLLQYLIYIQEQFGLVCDIYDIHVYFLEQNCYFCLLGRSFSLYIRIWFLLQGFTLTSLSHLVNSEIPRIFVLIS